MTKFRVLAMMIGLAASAGLGGCVTIFPNAKPAQLYRFGQEVGGASDKSAIPAGPVSGLRLSTGFTRVAEGDRILTSAGAETAYIAQARWTAPAAVLFDEAAARAFENASAPFRLLRRGDVGVSSLTLRLDVEAFETDYPPHWRGAPTVVVRVRTLLSRPAGQGSPVSQLFESRQAAGEDRVSSIVEAYDKATTDVLGQVVRWTTDQANAQGVQNPAQ